MLRGKGIRKRVSCTIAALVMTSLTLLGVTLAILIYITEKNQLQSFQFEVVDYAINEMSWDIHELETFLNIAIADNDLLGLKTDEAFVTLSQILNNKDIRNHNILDELMLLDNKGRERMRVSRTRVVPASEFGDRSATDDFTVPAATANTYYGPLTYDDAYQPQIKIALPILELRSNSLKGVLVGRIELNRTWGNVVSRSFGKAGYIFITNSDGKVVAHPDPSVIYRNTYYKSAAPYGIQAGLNGKKVMLASKTFSLGSRQFIVYASLPFSEVMGLSLEALYMTGAVLCIFILFSLLASSLAANHIVRPIEKLADNARQISSGKLDSIAHVGNSDEIGQLSDALDGMMSKMVDMIRSLEERNLLLDNILNSLTHPFYVIDADDYTIRLANPAANFGSLSGSEKCYSLTHNIKEPCSSSDHPCVIEKIKETGQPVVVEHIHYNSQGHPVIVEIHGYPLFDDKGNVTQVIEYNFDITARKKIEEELQLSEHKNRSITSTAKDAIIMVDDNGEVRFWNPAAEAIFGYREEEILGRELHNIIGPENYGDDFLKGIARFRDTGSGNVIGQTLEMTATRKDGTVFPIELSLSAFQMKGKWHAVGIVRDITQRKLAESRLLSSLEEKELLLQEIHHRVKNNMQVISSLLDLQLGYIHNKQPQEIFSEIKNRIKSMALVHEKLYMARDLSRVDFGDYLSTLIANLYRFYNISMSDVVLHLDVGDIAFGIDTAIPCGLVINELITNSLKYAFPEGRSGEISVAIQRSGMAGDGSDIYKLRVKDNGIGIPADLDLRQVKTLGLYLVNTLVEHQLRGTIHLASEHGTEFVITFREMKYKKRV